MRRSGGNNSGIGSFNNLSVLKRSIYHYGPQTVDELAEHIRRELPRRSLSTDEIRDTYVLLALEKQRYFIKLPDGRWDIEWDQAQAEENRTAEKILRSERMPLSLPEIRKRVSELLAKSIDEVRIDLDADPKFTAVGANHYALSEWRLLNDEAYELLARNPGHYLTYDEIVRRLAATNRFIEEQVIFAPKADQRFKKGPGGTWGLAEWWPAGARKTAKPVTSDHGLPIPVLVTPEQEALVTSKSAIIEAFIRGSRDAVRPRQIVEYVLGVMVGTAEYPPLVRAVNAFLGSRETFIQVGPEQWRLREQVPDDVWKDVTGVVSPRVLGTPVPDLEEDEEQPDAATRTKSGSDHSKAAWAWKVTLSYVNWRTGTLRVPPSKLALLPNVAGDVAEVHMLLAGSVSNEHPVWFNRKTQTIHGLRFVYESLGMLPGSVFHLSTSSQRTDQLVLRYDREINQKVLREQSRLMDSEALKETASKVGKSFRDILVEVMRANPSGLSFWQIFDEVSRIRPVAIATVRGLLSSLPCFYQEDPGSGYWHYDASKPMRPKLRLRTPHRLVTGKARSVASGSKNEDRVQKLEPIAEATKEELKQDRLDDLDSQGLPTDNGPRHEEHLEAVAVPIAHEAKPADGNTVMARVAALLAEGVSGDRALIREYLSRHHSVSIDRAFVFSNVPPPETIRRSRQILLNGDALQHTTEPNPSTVRDRVRVLLDDQALHGDDKKLMVVYYERHHGIRISAEYLTPEVPSMETIRRARQKLTAAVRLQEEAEEEKEDPDWAWHGSATELALVQVAASPEATPASVAHSSFLPACPAQDRVSRRFGAKRQRREGRWVRLAKWLWTVITGKR